MFDIGFAELLIIGVVALLVIGPERLPGALRTGSAWLNRIRRGFNDIKQEVQQELHNDAVLRDLRESGEQLKRETEALRQDLQTDLSTTEAATDSTSEPAPAPATPAPAGSASEQTPHAGDDVASKSRIGVATTENRPETGSTERDDQA